MFAEIVKDYLNSKKINAVKFLLKASNYKEIKHLLEKNLKYLEEYNFLLVKFLEHWSKSPNRKTEISFFKEILARDCDLKIVFEKIEINNNLVNFLFEKYENNLLYKNSFNLSKSKKLEILGREFELKIMSIIISRHYKNNILLVGDNGIGKTSLVTYFSQIKNLDILSLNIGQCISNTKYRGEFESILENIINIAIEQKKILFIDEIHTLINAGKSEGGVSAANIMKPYLTHKNFRVIGATTTEEYINIFKLDKAFERRFNILKLVMVEKSVLRKIVLSIEKNILNKRVLKISTIDYSIEILDVNLKERNFPDKLIDFFDFYFAYLNFDKAEHSEKFMKKVMHDYLRISN